MNKITTAVFLLLTFAVSVFPQTNPSYGIRDKSPTKKALVNATIVVSPTQTLNKGILIIEDGRILNIGIDIPVPIDAQLIDLEGYLIYPGFIDPYTDYGLKEFSYPKNKSGTIQFEAERTGGSAANQAIHSEVNWVDYFKPDKKTSDQLMKLGITTVQSNKNDGVFRGRSFVTLLGEGHSNDLVINPYNLQVCSFDKGSSPQQYPNSLMGCIALIRQTFYDVDWYVAAHNAFARNQHQPMPEFNSAIQALAEYEKTPYIFDSNDELSLLRAEKIAKEFELDFIHVGSGYEYCRLQEIKNTGAALILPAVIPKTPEIETIEDELDISLAELRHWETAPYNPYLIDSADISFAFTQSKLSDGRDFLTNIRTMINKGLSKSSALEALTIIPATYCGIDNLCGTLEPGKLANFIVTDTDIFEPDAIINEVWIKGQKYDIQPRQYTGFPGVYTLTYADNQATLILEEKKHKIKGLYVIEKDTVKLKNVSLIDNKLSFTISQPDDSPEGTYRFSGRQDKTNTITGKGSLPDGSRFEWTALYISSPDTTESSGRDDSNKDKQIEARIANFTYPNKAFGRTSLPEQQNIHVKNITIWTAENEGILTDTDILIKDGKISIIGRNLKTPEGYVTIDGTGKHLTPGILDAHSHIAISGNVNECTEAITAEVRIEDVVNPDDISIYRQLAGGTTCALIIHGSCNPIGGQAQAIKLRWGANAEEMKITDAFPTIKFALGENVKRSGWGDRFNTRYPVTRMGVETIIRDEFQTALEYDKKWQDYYSLSNSNRQKTVPPRKDLELDAVSETINSKRDIQCHAYVQNEILMLMRLAEQYDFIVQCFIHVLEGYKVAVEMAEHGATGTTFSDWWSYKFEVYDAIPYNVNLMAEKGVLTSINSDNADLGRRLNLEAAKAVMYGENMSQEEAIKFCTINPAKQLKLDDRLGSIKIGKDADFVIWNGNPLSIYSRAEQTWIDGRKYFDINDDHLMRKENSVERNKLIQKILNSKSEKSKDYKKDYKQPQHYRDYDNSYDYWSDNYEN